MRTRTRTVVVALLAMVAGIPAAALPVVAHAAPAAVPAAATPGSITLAVASARTVRPQAGFVHEGDAVTAYKWIVNEDATGNPGTATAPLTDQCLPSRATGGSTNPNYADTCPWPSTRRTSGFAPIVAQGDESDLNRTKALEGLPPGKYLISVTAKDFKIDGAHFTVTPGGTQQVSVAMNPTPLPLSTIKIQVFEDNAPVDGTYEVGAEQGRAGFTANLTDVFGPVSVDYYGNALCTVYKHRTANVASPILFDADDRPIVDTTRSTGKCVSDASGVITIPNLGPNRYAALVTPPAPVAGQTYQWVQTTTLEGAHDHDIWIQEGSTGLDTEIVKGAEPVPAVQFGFVRTKALPSGTRAPKGEVKGSVVAGLPYVGGQGGQVIPETGFAGAKVGGPIKSPWVALSDLGAGDAAVYVGRGATNGSFDIKNVPDGAYQLTLWDDDQDYILWSFNVTVVGGNVVDVGQKMLVGWFTHIYGSVFIDSNGDGVRDPGERGVPGFGLTLRERDNSLMDQYTNTVSTNTEGSYDIREGYPLSKWLVLEAFNTRYRTTGVTWQAENETEPTTQLGGLVDLSVLPVIGLGGRVDWGVEPVPGAENGGIAGTVTYDVTRNELDPADAATEGYQPGIPGIDVHLYASKPCTATTDEDKANTCRQGKEIVPLKVTGPDGTLVDNPDPQRGALARGPELADSTTTEEYAPPRGCTARKYNGAELTDQQALPESGAAPNRMCVEAPMMGFTAGPSDSTEGDGAQTVNGNYGFSESNLNLFPVGDDRNPAPDHDLPLYANLKDAGYDPQPLTASDYIVGVDIPDNPVGGKPMYKVTSEEDINVFTGDTYLPQENYPPATPAIAADPGDPPAPEVTPPSQDPSQTGGIVSGCAGPLHKVNVTDEDFLAGGGSPFQGQDRPSCQDKLVTVRAGQTTAPTFSLFTDVPIPTHFWGLTINDLGLSLDKRSANYGEAQGLPYVPVGLYDYAGRLAYTAHTDFNGMYEALMPSTGTYNCPVPAGPCPNMYRFTGNDPGVPGALNTDYNPRFRTISATFQGWPGLYTVTDTAPTQVAATVLTPDTTVANNTVCDVDPVTPQLFAVDKVYVRLTDSNAQRLVTIRGRGFGASQGAGSVRLGSANANVISWSDEVITIRVGANAAAGAQQLDITASNGQHATNSLTLHVLDAVGAAGTTQNNPRIAEVAPSGANTYRTIQAALEAARPTNATPYWLVVVRPGAATAVNPRGEYSENLIVHNRVQVQGFGPGGFAANGSWVPGTIVDGSSFSADQDSGTAWIALLNSLSYAGARAVPDGAVFTVLSPSSNAVPTAYPLMIDGFQVTGGIQVDQPTNVNVITGGVSTPYGATGALIAQGGGIYAHNAVMGLRVTNNVIVGNGGSYGGGIRIGTPYAGNSRNYGPVISHNQIRDNGGTNLAGGIGLFEGSDGYSVDHNAICGNHSSEYGGGVSAYGYQAHPAATSAGYGPGGSVDHNTIWFNSSYDEGGGVMIAGELPADPNTLSEGTGPVKIDSNQIRANLANDDGGGIRLLQTSGSHISQSSPETISITNNTIANNVSAHEGGGIALDDAAFVEVVDNTVVKNLTTATAITSDGTPAAAGLSTASFSDPLLKRLRNTNQFPSAPGVAAAGFAKPTLLDDLFWDNRAGSYVGGWVRGIGGTLPDGTTNDTNNWDMGVMDLPGAQLHPVNSVLQTTTGTDGGASTRVSANPQLRSPYDLTVDVLAARAYPAFRQAAIVTTKLPLTLLGDYHLANGSVAIGAGVASTAGPLPGTTVVAPGTDIDGRNRPTNPGRRYDAGSAQFAP
ncbi:IPT/TIG domain-containing protein [Phycicoccus sp. Root101]|uniref:IPT/TIG domain-containing protein n=1 Tax=Phycicoccus sp. Root101 TaxID=1736421 RepID=UPI0007024FE8|nr:IPT/TIG domain-containing protein [Phycicoccus sp. Root101]KQU69438.1 hypothetical protein ASC58_06045 [Phycicoccus sp. Root101]